MYFPNSLGITVILKWVLLFFGRVKIRVRGMKTWWINLSNK